MTTRDLQYVGTKAVADALLVSGWWVRRMCELGVCDAARVSNRSRSWYMFHLPELMQLRIAEILKSRKGFNTIAIANFFDNCDLRHSDFDMIDVHPGLLTVIVDIDQLRRMAYADLVAANAQQSGRRIPHRQEVPHHIQEVTRMVGRSFH